MHPAINRTLVELGIVKDITVKESNVVVTMAFPFPEVTTKEQLMNSVREPIMKLGVEVEVNLTVMNQEELQAFLTMEQESWKGA